jgi:hypothetical protein
LLAHLGFLGEAHLGRGLGDIEDDELLAVLCRHKAELRARRNGMPNPAPQRTESATSVSGSPMALESAGVSESGHERIS